MGWIFGFIVLLFIAPLLGVAGGAFSGWVVGLFFDETIHSTLSAFGVHLRGVALWEIGATLGFIGGFFRAVQTNNNG